MHEAAQVPTEEFVSPCGGSSYGLEYPYRYKEDGQSWVVFSTYDGWVWRRFLFSAEPGDAWQRRYFSERAAARFCRAVNGFSDDVDPRVLADIDAQE